jgi:hypothetical protein
MSKLPERDAQIVAIALQIDLASFEITFRIRSSDGSTTYLTSRSSCTSPRNGLVTIGGRMPRAERED